MNFQTKIYVGNLPENCDLQAFRSLFEKYGKVVECDIVKNYGFVHFVDGEDAKTAVDRLNDKQWDGITLKVELSYSKVRHKPGMGSKSLCYRCGKCGHWSKDCPKGPSRRGPLWKNNNNNNNSSYSENRNQPLLGNRGFFMNIGETSGSSDPFLGRNSYRNNPFRDSYRGFTLSSPPYCERNHNVKNTYSSNNNNNNYHNNSGYHRDTSDNNSNRVPVIGLSRIQEGRDLSRYDDDDDEEEPSSHDNYPPPPPPPTRYRPYPSAYERRAPLPPLPGNPGNFITPPPPLPPPQLSSPPPPPSLSQYHHRHHNNNNSNNHSHHHNSSSLLPSSHNGNNGNNVHDAYVRPTAEYYERRRGYHSAPGIPRRQDEREK